MKCIEKMQTKTYIYTKLNYYIMNKTLSIAQKKFFINIYIMIKMQNRKIKFFLLYFTISKYVMININIRLY